MKIQIEGSKWLTIVDRSADVSNETPFNIIETVNGDASTKAEFTITGNVSNTFDDVNWKCFTIFKGEIEHVFYFKEYGVYYHPDIVDMGGHIRLIHQIDINKTSTGTQIHDRMRSIIEYVFGDKMTFSNTGVVLTCTMIENGEIISPENGTIGEFISDNNFQVDRIIAKSISTPRSDIGNNTVSYNNELFEFRICKDYKPFVKYSG